MDKKDKSENTSSFTLEVLKPDVFWEHQERAVYTVDAMEKEIKERLGPKKGQSQEEDSK